MFNIFIAVVYVVVVSYFRVRRLILAPGKLRSLVCFLDSPLTGIDLLRVFLPRIPLEDAVDVSIVDAVDAVDDRSLDAFRSMVVLRARDDGGNLFAIFLPALRLGCGDCVSVWFCSSDNGDVDVLRRRSRFSPFTLLFVIFFVGPFCTCFRRVVGVDGPDDDESRRFDRRPFTVGGDDDRPFGRRGLDTLLDIDDFRDDERDDALLSPFDTNGAIFFKCSRRCVGLLMRSTVRRFLVITFFCLNSATRAFRVRCALCGELSFTSS